jgi:hypothetical protein
VPPVVTCPRCASWFGCSPADMPRTADATRPDGGVTRYRARAAFRGLHPGTDRHGSRLLHRNSPFTPRIITQVTCVKDSVRFFGREHDSETRRDVAGFTNSERKKERRLRCGLYPALYAKCCVCLSADRGATARSAWYSRKYFPDSQRCSLSPFRWRTRCRHESLRQSPDSTSSTARTASRFAWSNR